MNLSSLRFRRHFLLGIYHTLEFKIMWCKCAQWKIRSLFCFLVVYNNSKFTWIYARLEKSFIKLGGSVEKVGEYIHAIRPFTLLSISALNLRSLALSPSLSLSLVFFRYRYLSLRSFWDLAGEFPHCIRYGVHDTVLRLWNHPLLSFFCLSAIPKTAAVSPSLVWVSLVWLEFGLFARFTMQREISRSCTCTCERECVCVCVWGKADRQK